MYQSFHFFYYFDKKRMFSGFFNVFYFLVAKLFNSPKPAKLLHKTTFKWWLSHGSYGKFFGEEISNIVMHTTKHEDNNFTREIFSFGMNNFVS